MGLSETMKADRERHWIEQRFSRLLFVLTPFILLISFIPMALPQENLALVADSALSIMALAILGGVSIVILKPGDPELRRLTASFLLFSLLFLTGEFLSFTRLYMGSQTLETALFYLSHVFWFAGYVPLIYVCWGTLLRYSEYADEKSIIMTSFVTLGIAAVLLIPISISIVNSPYLGFPQIKVLAIIYPYMDCIVLFSLLFLLPIYRKGKLAFYWSAVTVGILLFTSGDIGNAIILAYNLSYLSTITSGFFIMAYFYLAFSLAIVGYLRRKTAVMEPEGRYVVRQAFLVNKAGILIAHRGREKDTIDTDILSSMLTAVQDFIKDSFDREGPTKERLKRLQYGKLEIHIEHGKYVYLALVVDGPGTERLHTRMNEMVSRIEADYANDLAFWDGNAATFADVGDYMKELL